MGHLLTLFGDVRPHYLLRDLFTTDAAASLASPRTCEPGPGTLTLVDTTGRAITHGRRLVWYPWLGEAGTAPPNDPAFTAGPFVRKAGRAMLMTTQRHGGALTAPLAKVGWATNDDNDGADAVGLSFLADNTLSGLAATALYTYLNGTTYRIAQVMRSTGYFTLLYDGKWHLLWPETAGTTDPAYIAATTGEGITKSGYLGVKDLGGAWLSDAGINTSHLDAPADQATCTMTATNATLQVVPGGVKNFSYRVSADERFQLNVAADGCSLVEYPAATTRGTVSGKAACTDLVVTLRGHVHKVYYNHELVITYTDALAASWLTRTVVRAESAGLTSITCWPYDVTALMPASLAPTGKQFVFDGDSLTIGDPSYSPFADRVMDARSDVRHWRNFAVAGQGLTTGMASDAATQIDTMYDATTYTGNVLVVLGGTNNIFGGETAASIQTQLQDYCLVRQAVGWRVIVMTIPPAVDYTAGQDAVQAAVNVWIRDNYAGFADGLCDIAADARLTDPSDTDYYYVDGTHLNDGGYAVVSELLEATLNASTLTNPTTATTTFEALAQGIGRISGQSATYATARATSSYSDGWQPVWNDLGMELAAGTYKTWRMPIHFDTSSLAGKTITKVQLKLIALTAWNDADGRYDIEIVKADWPGQDPITAGNREAVYDAILAGATDAVWRNTNGMLANTPYTSPNLDTARVNTAGITYYGLRTSFDRLGTVPTGSDLQQIATEANATVAYRPQLIVTYEV